MATTILYRHSSSSFVAPSWETQIDSEKESVHWQVPPCTAVLLDFAIVFPVSTETIETKSLSQPLGTCHTQHNQWGQNSQTKMELNLEEVRNTSICELSSNKKYQRKPKENKGHAIWKILVDKGTLFDCISWLLILGQLHVTKLNILPAAVPITKLDTKNSTLQILSAQHIETRKNFTLKIYTITPIRCYPLCVPCNLTNFKRTPSQA